jgi:hypothetical protein
VGEHDLSPSWPAVESASVSDELDLDKWIDGTCGLTRTAKIYQRGDLIAAIDRLEAELATAREVEKTLPKGERGLNDRGAEQIQREIDALSAEVLQSALIVHVQDRTEERREKIRARLRKDLNVKPDEVPSFEDAETMNIAQIADSIIKLETPDGKVRSLPDGLPPNKLREMIQRLGDAALGELWTAFRRVTMEAPSVSAPLSRRSSSGHGGIT